MKVLLINGSPRQNGNTHAALAEAAKVLEAEGIEAQLEWIGKAPIRGCIGCGKCKEKGENRCIFNDDRCNALIEKAAEADGYLIGSPVYYAGANGTLISLLDRMFYAGGSLMRFKPGAGIAVARRAGTTLTIDQINKYFQINCMPVAPSTYWPMVHGRAEGEAVADAEGMRAVRNLARNLAWMMRSFKAAQAEGIEHPDPEAGPTTNFIREDLLGE